jgi:ribosomal protein L34E
MSDCKFVADLGKQPKCVECGAAIGKGTCGVEEVRAPKVREPGKKKKKKEEPTPEE